MPDAIERVTRSRLIGDRREWVEIITAVGIVVTVYVSPGGRNVRVFRRRKFASGNESTVELKEAK